MASVNGITAEYAQSILDGTVESAAVVNGTLVFYRKDGSEFAAGKVGGGGGVGAGAPRTDVSVTTASLADQASASGTVELSSGYRLAKIVTDRPCRVRLYATAAQRDADISRDINTDPTGDHGLMFEFVSSAALLNATLSPMVDGYSLEAPVGTPPVIGPDIPYSITNLSGSASPVTVTLTWQKTE